MKFTFAIFICLLPFAANAAPKNAKQISIETLAKCAGILAGISNEMSFKSKQDGERTQALSDKMNNVALSQLMARDKLNEQQASFKIADIGSGVMMRTLDELMRAKSKGQSDDFIYSKLKSCASESEFVGEAPNN